MSDTKSEVTVVFDRDEHLPDIQPHQVDIFAKRAEKLLYGETGWREEDIVEGLARTLAVVLKGLNIPDEKGRYYWNQKTQGMEKNRWGYVNLIDSLLYKAKLPKEQRYDTLRRGAKAVCAIQQLPEPEDVNMPDDTPDDTPGPLKMLQLDVNELTDEDVQSAFGLPNAESLKERLNLSYRSLVEGRSHERLLEELSGVNLSTGYRAADFKSSPLGIWTSDDFNYADPAENKVGEGRDSSTPDKNKQHDQNDVWDVLENPYVQETRPTPVGEDGATADLDQYVLPFDRTDPKALADYTAHLMTEFVEGSLVPHESDTLPLELDLLLTKTMMTAARGMTALTGDEQYAARGHQMISEGYKECQIYCGFLLGTLSLKGEPEWSFRDLILEGMQNSPGWEETGQTIQEPRGAQTMKRGEKTGCIAVDTKWTLSPDSYALGLGLD